MKYTVTKNNTYSCIFEGSTSIPGNPDILTTIRKITSGQGDSTAETSKLVGYENYFRIYNSPYSGAFPLLDTMNIPRPCAEASVNLTQFTYFYGMNKQNYSIRGQAN